MSTATHPVLMAQPDASAASALFHRTVAHTQREAETYAPAFAPPLSVQQHRTLGECAAAAGYPAPGPSSRDAWTLGGRYDPERSAYMHEAWRFFGELRALRRAGCTVRCYMIPETNVLQVEFRRVARPRPVPPDVGDAVHEWADAADDAADARAAHLTAERVGGA